MSATRHVEASGSRRAIGCAAAAVLVATVVAPAWSATHTVTIAGMAYAPATVRVAKGDRIVWLNRDLVPHTTSARDGSFESGRIDPGQQWSLVVTAAGAFDYVCSYHPMMQGRLEVQ